MHRCCRAGVDDHGVFSTHRFTTNEACMALCDGDRACTGFEVTSKNCEIHTKAIAFSNREAVCTCFVAMAPPNTPGDTQSPPSEAAKSCKQLGWRPYDVYSGGTTVDAVCGASQFDGRCAAATDYANAAATCSHMDARLCTAFELQSDAARMTGCDLDSQLVWVKSQPEVGMCMTAPGSSKGVRSAGEEYITSCGEEFAVRCCADAGSRTTDANRMVATGPGPCRTNIGGKASHKSAGVSTDVHAAATAAECVLRCEQAKGCEAAEHSSKRRTCTLFYTEAALLVWYGGHRRFHGWHADGDASGATCFVKFIDRAPATDAPTDAPTTTTTARATTKAPTTKAPTTKAPTSKAPTTKAPTSKTPTTTTTQATTNTPTTTTTQATTKAPTTKAPSTKAPTTKAPITRAPSTKAPPTAAPATYTCEQLGWRASQIHVPSRMPVCGSSTSRRGACFAKASTHTAAAATCTTAGARLCSALELAKDVTRGTGCALDEQPVWHAGMGLAGGSTRWGRVQVKKGLVLPKPDGKTRYGVRCCSHGNAAAEPAPAQHGFTELGPGHCRGTSGSKVTPNNVLGRGSKTIAACADKCREHNDAHRLGTATTSCLGFEFNQAKVPVCRILISKVDESGGKNTNAISHAMPQKASTARCFVVSANYQCANIFATEGWETAGACDDGDTATSEDVCNAQFQCAGVATTTTQHADETPTTTPSSAGIGSGSGQAPPSRFARARRDLMKLEDGTQYEHGASHHVQSVTQLVAGSCGILLGLGLLAVGLKLRPPLETPSPGRR